MRNRLARVLVMASALTALASPAAAQSVDYTVSGSPGNWLANFRLNNSIPLVYDHEIYFWGLDYDDDASITGSPAGWDVWLDGAVWDDDFGTYDLNWTTNSLPSFVQPGASLDGFLVTFTGATPPSSVNWFMYTVGASDPVPGTYSPIDLPCGQSETLLLAGCNPGFAGTATDLTTIPEPASVALLAFGLAAAAMLKRKRFVAAA